ncbi:hypothetical protein [Streptomyces sp. NPDC088794]|uniref:hypothetical protein n=1 Tax=Streptomyces sp. NPDC088794 TaxID=3365902 RepID=UPI003823EDB4
MSSLTETAVDLHVAYEKARRAGSPTDEFLTKTVIPATDRAVAAGADFDSIHADADRKYGQWLIDNAGE